MNSVSHNRVVPDIIMLLGMDAAGKDHIADILVQMIHETGCAVEKRHRFLSGKFKPVELNKKKAFELLLERLFLRVYPLGGFLLPLILNRLLKLDLMRFRKQEKKVIVVGHNYLRGLAFYWEHRYDRIECIHVSPALKATLFGMQSLAGFHPLIIIVDERLRKERIKKRMARGEADFFDQYMMADSNRAKRIENVLKWLTCKYLNGCIIENNDLSEFELRKFISTRLLSSS